MKTSFKKLAGSQVELEISLDQKEFEPYWKESYEKSLQAVNLKGFRPGAAPKELAEKAIDQEKVFSEAANKAIRFSLDEAAEENKWTIIDAPKVEVSDGGLGLKYKALLTLFPELKLANYKKIAKKISGEKKKISVDQAETDKTLDWIRNSRAITKLVNRPAKMGDLVEVDIESFLDKVPVKGAQLRHDRFVLGDSRLMPGFDEKLVGHSAGEQAEFILMAPEDYWHKDLRGKNVEFKVKITSVFERELPELNDEFAKGLGKFNNIEELKKSVADGILHEKETKENDRIRAKIMEEIIKESEIDIPDIMIEKTLDGMTADAAPMVKAQGLKEGEVREQLRPRAKNNVAMNLVIYKIAEMENLKPTDEEVQREAEGMTGRLPQKADPKQYYNYSFGAVQNRKVFEFLESQ